MNGGFQDTTQLGINLVPERTVNTWDRINLRGEVINIVLTLMPNLDPIQLVNREWNRDMVKIGGSTLRGAEDAMG